MVKFTRKREVFAMNQTETPASLIMIFGATGDLAKRNYILPYIICTEKECLQSILP